MNGLMRTWVFRALAVVGLFSGTGAHAATLIHSYNFNGSGVVDSVGGANGSLVGGATVSGGTLNLGGNYVQFSQYLVPTAGAFFSVILRAQRTQSTANFSEMISQGQTGGGGFISVPIHKMILD